MVKSGLELFLGKIPQSIKGKRVGVLCHAPSITPDYRNIADHFHKANEFRLAAIFGPQHGLFGQTQDNMIEWEGYVHPVYKVPVYSLYGIHRKPSKEMLETIDALVIDLQDVGARLYTYVWTMKLCMEACQEASIPVWILDRPNPIAGIWYDGPVLKKEYFTFVGGASIPLCHRMTIAEIAIWLKAEYYPGCNIEIIKMENWNRSLMYDQTGLPWVLPSPNMPSLTTAVVYPGMVLLEALNLSEGRGTTLPFEIFGAPYLDSYILLEYLENRNIRGCKFRIHPFIPTFNKYQGIPCNGIQIHVSDRLKFRPVETALELIDAVIRTSPAGVMKFNDPPYEYEQTLLPFDILSGDNEMRKVLCSGGDLGIEKMRWKEEIEIFRKKFCELSIYGDC